MLMKNLNKSSSLNKNQEINGAIVYVIDFLSNDVSNIERIKALNQEVLLNEGKIEISDGINQLILNDSTISNIKNYIKPKTPSRKKRLLPIIVSVFLALFVGIFLAFVIEFFNREDVLESIEFFFSQTLNKEAGVPKSDTKKSAKSIIEGIKKFKIWN